MVSDETMDLFVHPFISITHQPDFSRTIKYISITSRIVFMIWVEIIIINFVIYESGLKPFTARLK